MTTTTKVFNRRHWIVPEEDTVLMVEQKPCVLKFWHQCWSADPYGSRWMKLVTNLSDSAFRLGRRILEATRLFVFRRVSYESDGRTSYWEVRNLHGARVKDFWRGVKNEAVSTSSKADTAPQKTITASNKAPVLVKTFAVQAFHEPSGTPQEHITNSSKEFVMCVSSTPAEISQVDKTAIAPLEGASPQTIEGVEEIEFELDLPAATDCTTLTLVDEQESQSASVRDAARTFLTENKDPNVEPESPHEDTCSAPQVEVVMNLNKWSDDAIVQRRELRSQRQSKLRCAGLSGDNPGFEFLIECWDDVVLRNKIKQVIARYPEWGIASVDQKLVCSTNQALL